MYTLRTKEGEMRAKFSNEIARKYINECEGEWKHTDTKKLVYRIASNYTWTFGDQMKFFAWTGDYFSEMDWNE